MRALVAFKTEGEHLRNLAISLVTSLRCMSALPMWPSAHFASGDSEGEGNDKGTRISPSNKTTVSIYLRRRAGVINEWVRMGLIVPGFVHLFALRRSSDR